MTKPRQFPCEIISWATVASLSQKLATQVRNSDFKPDTVIAIARGGYVPARLLCDYLHLTDLSSFRIVHYTSGAEKKKNAKLVDPLCRDLGGRKVLLVDDVSDTGDTLELARAHLAERNATSVRSAVLQHKKTSVIMPDFHAQVIFRWRWIIYPWAVTEDLTGLIERLPNVSTDVQQIADQLKKEFGLSIRRSLLDKVLSFSPA